MRKIDTFSGGLRSINEWCSAHDEVDLGLTWDVIKYLHWKTKWLTNSMTSEDFLEFDYDALKILKYGTLVK